MTPPGRWLAFDLASGRMLARADSQAQAARAAAAAGGRSIACIDAGRMAGTLHLRRLSPAEARIALNGGTGRGRGEGYHGQR